MLPNNDMLKVGTVVAVECIFEALKCNPMGTRVYVKDENLVTLAQLQNNMIDILAFT